MLKQSLELHPTCSRVFFNWVSKVIDDCCDFAWNSPCDWSRMLASPSQTIIFKTWTNRDLITCVFPPFTQYARNDHNNHTTYTPMAFHEVEQHQKELTANKTSPASIPPTKKIKKKEKIIIKIYHLTKSIYSSVVRNIFSCLIVLLAAVWSPELGLYIFLFGWCVYWFVSLSCWSVSGRFGSGRKREGRLTRVENRKEVWVG